MLLPHANYLQQQILPYRIGICEYQYAICWLMAEQPNNKTLLPISQENSKFIRDVYEL